MKKISANYKDACLYNLSYQIKVDFEQKVFVMIFSCMKTSFKEGISILVSHMLI